MGTASGETVASLQQRVHDWSFRNACADACQTIPELSNPSRSDLRALFVDTEFVIAALGGDGETPSPTFTLVQLYELPEHEVYHFDLFRLEKADEVLELGIEDAFADGVSLIEWPERMGSYLPWTRLDITLSRAEANGVSDSERRIVIEDHGMLMDRLDALHLDDSKIR